MKQVAKLHFYFKTEKLAHFYIQLFRVLVCPSTDFSLLLLDYNPPQSDLVRTWYGLGVAKGQRGEGAKGGASKMLI